MSAPDLARATELYVAVQLAVIGASHVAQSAVWVDMYRRLEALKHVGVFVTGFLSLIFGAIIIAFHDVWRGWPVVVTLLGWAHIAKAALAFVAPSVGLRVLARVSLERAWEVQLGGAAFLLLAAWLGARLVFDAGSL